MAEPFRIFLSYNRRDIADVERLARALTERGVTPFKDDWYLSPGEHWPSSLDRHLAHCRAVAVVIGASGLGPWQQREVYAAIDREVRERAEGRECFRVIPVLLSEGALAHAGVGFLSQNVWVEAWDPRAADLILGAVEGTPPAELYDEAHPDPRTLFCPYRGLRVFREEDQAFYFGCEEDLEKLVAAAGLYPIVAIVGPSGSGKSSLARAGFIPCLRGRAAAGSGRSRSSTTRARTRSWPSPRRCCRSGSRDASSNGRRTRHTRRPGRWPPAFGRWGRPAPQCRRADLRRGAGDHRPAC